MTPTITPTHTVTPTITPTPSTTPISLECASSTYDVILLLDQSGSIGDSNYTLMSNATVDLVSKLSPYLSSGATGFQFGVVAFSNAASVLQELTSDQNLINTALVTRVFSAGTRIDFGLQVSYFTSIGTNTRNANKKIVLYTDGNPNPGTEVATVLTADTINASVYNSVYKTEILCVGVGGGVDYSNLYEYAADTSLVFSATTFADIQNINTQIVNGICQQILTPSQTPSPTQTPTQTASPTPTPTQLSTIYTHGAVIGTCSDYCITNYDIFTLTNADANYSALGIGDTIYGQLGISGYVAYSDVPTDTTAGPFKIAEIDSSGVITNIFQCFGGSCVPL
jgi:uncharacterized protein YegL